MSNEPPVSPERLAEALTELPGWEVRDGWLRRKYVTPGWAHTLLLANTIGFLAEAAWHHPDLELGYAQVVVKLQTHKARAITESDIALAREIEHVVMWKVVPDGPLPGFPKNWIR